MGYKHTFNNTGDGNFYLATESGVPKLHTYEESSVVNLTIYQSGPDVILTAEGSFHDPELSLSTWYGNVNAYVYPHLARFEMMGQSSDTAYAINVTSYFSNQWPDLGAATIKSSDTVSADLPAHFLVERNVLRIRPDYVWGTYFSQTVTFSNTTLVDLGYDTFGSFTGVYGADGNYTVNLTVVTPPTPTPTPTVSFSATPTPTASPVPATPTPTPSRSYENPATYGVIGTTTQYTGTNDSAGFDGGGYVYDWDLIPNKFSSGGITWVSDSTSGQNFPIGSVRARGTTMGDYPRFFKPYVTGYPNVKVVCPYSSRRRVWLLGAGIEGGGDIYYTYSYRNTTTGAISTTSTYSLHMDDWCAGSTSQSVFAAMSQRLTSSGGPNVLTTRIYRYELAQLASGNEIISINFFNNTDGFNCRVVSVAWATS